jgi:hypothetical protein
VRSAGVTGIETCPGKLTALRSYRAGTVGHRSATKTKSSEPEENVNRPRAADDFTTIYARMLELRREGEAALATNSEAKSDPPTRSYRNGYWAQREIAEGQGWVRQSGQIRS